MTPESATLAAKLCEYQAAGWRLAGEYATAGAALPPPLARFLGVPHGETTIDRHTRVARPKKKKGPREVVLPAILAFFAGRGNEPATYREITEATGARLGRLRAAISRNNADLFERVGTKTEGDKAYAIVRLSPKGVDHAAGSQPAA